LNNNNDINLSNSLVEINLYTDYSKLLYQTGQLRALGGILFTDYILSIILISILLFLSMFGSIVMTLETHAYKIIKEQDANIQGLRHPSMTSLSYRFTNIKE
jgi:hypothetical protein